MASPANIFKVRGVVEILTRGAVSALEQLKGKVDAVDDSTINAVKSLQRMGLLFGTLAAPLGFAVKAAGDFDSAMRDVNSIAQLNEMAYRELSASIADLSNEYQLASTPIENAAGLYEILQAGITDVDKAQELLVISSQAATAGLTKVRTAADLLTSVMNAYAGQNLNAQRASDVLFKTIEVGKVSFNELANGLGRSLGPASALNISLEELGAVVATLTSKGIPARQAMFSLRAVIRNLSAPSKKAKDALADLGLAIDENTLKQKGLFETLVMIREATGGNAEQMKAILGDTNAVSAAISLTNENAEQYKRTLDDLRDSSGATQRAFEQQAKGMRVKWKQFTAALQQAGIIIGSTLLPPVLAVVTAFTDMLKVFNSMDPVLRNVIMGTAALATGFAGIAFAAGPLLTLNKALVAVAAKSALVKTAFDAVTASQVTQTAATTAQGTHMGIVNGQLVQTGAASTTAAAGTDRLTASLSRASAAALRMTAALTSITVIAGAALFISNQYAEAMEREAQAILETSRAMAGLNQERKKLLDVDPETALKEGATIADYQKLLTKQQELWTNAMRLRDAGKLSEEEYQRRVFGVAKRDAAGDIIYGEDRQPQMVTKGIKGTVDEIIDKMHRAMDVEGDVKKEREKTDAHLAKSLMHARDLDKEFQKNRRAGIWKTKAEELKAYDEVREAHKKAVADIDAANKAGFSDDSKMLSGLNVKGTRERLEQLNLERIRLERDYNAEAKRERDKRTREAAQAEIEKVRNALASRRLTNEQALASYKNLLKNQNMLDQQRVSLVRTIAQLEGTIHDEKNRKIEERARSAAQERKKVLDNEKKALESAKGTADDRISSLVKQKASEDEINAALDERARLLTEIAKKEKEAALAGVKSAKIRASIEDAYNAKVTAITEETQTKKEELNEKVAKKTLKDNAKSSNKSLELENKNRDTEMKLLEEKSNALKKTDSDYLGKKKKLMKAQHELRLKNLENELQSALNSAEAEGRLAQDGAMIKKRFEAEKRLEIAKTKRAIKELQETEKGGKSGGMNIIKSFDEMAKQGFTGFSTGFGTSSQDASLRGLGSSGQSAADKIVSRMGKGPTTSNNAKLDLSEQVVRIKIDVDGEVHVVDSGGLSSSTANSIFSDIGLKSALLGARAGKNSLGGT